MGGGEAGIFSIAENWVIFQSTFMKDKISSDFYLIKISPIYINSVPLKNTTASNEIEFRKNNNMCK